MIRFMSLIRFTDKGARAVRQTVKRAHDFDQVAEQAGVLIEAQYWSVGRYDGVLVMSAEKPDQILRLLTKLTAAGNVRTETLQLFDDLQFASALEKT